MVQRNTKVMNSTSVCLTYIACLVILVILHNIKEFFFLLAEIPARQQ